MDKGRKMAASCAQRHARPRFRKGSASAIYSLTEVTRFRCSSHDLRVERDRYLPAAAKPPRHMRTCLLCASQSVEDEHHFIFECPLYESLRFRFSDLFSTDGSTVHCFLEQSQDRVAEYLYSCFELRRRTAYMSLAGSDNAFSL